MTKNTASAETNTLSDSINNVITNELITRIKDKNSKNIVSSILDDFIDMIMSGRLQPGYAFPNENTMCQQLNISRSTLREIYSALSAMGFIKRSKSGTVVSSFQNIASSVPLRYLLRSSNMENLRDFRFTLESQTAYFAAQRASIETIDSLHRILDKMKHYSRSTKAELLSRLDYEFHITIAQASDNVLLLNTLSATVTELEGSAFSGFYLKPERTIPKSIEYHEKILEAIESHSPDLAKQLMEAHIKDVYVGLTDF